MQPNTRWKALAEIYKMHSFAPLSTFNFFPKKIAKILLIFIEILLHFAKILQYFDEISLEFCRDLPGENAPASGSSREFSRSFPGVFQDLQLSEIAPNLQFPELANNCARPAAALRDLVLADRRVPGFCLRDTACPPVAGHFP